MKTMFKKLVSIIMVTLHLLFYVFDISVTFLLGELNLVSAGRCYEETVNAMARLCKVVRKYIGIEKCNEYLDTVYERNIVVYYDIIDRMN